MSRKKKVDMGYALRSWVTLNEVISDMTEAQLTRALQVERSNKKRKNVIRRLHQRLTRARTNRERGEL